MKKDFIVRRSITMIDGKPHVETYSEQELVRCKDCKYAHKTYNGDCKYCDMFTDDDWNPIEFYRSGEWFCADGERRRSGNEQMDKRKGQTAATT